MSRASDGMNESHESGSRAPELDLDLQLLPAWAQRPPTDNQYSKYEGDTRDRPGRRGDGRQDRRGPPRHQGGPGGGSPRDERRPQGAGPRRPRPDGRPPNRGGGQREDRRIPEPPPIDIDISLIPDDKGVESLAKQIKLTGRAYPLFDIAFLILKKPDRYNVRYEVVKKPDGKIAQPLLLCELDETLWLSDSEAIDHILDKHFATFYQTERTPTDPPKGTYTFVAQCGMSGAILGPPNYHDYQNKLRKLHTERFSRMPFEAFKSRIKIVRDEAVVKKWTEDQSWKLEYICLNVPESTKLGSREEVEKHFREVHFPIVIKSVESHILSGRAAQALPLPALQRMVRSTWEDQMRFPLRIVTVLSQQLATYGLQFFKVNKTVTHVSVARPRHLDLEATSVSDGIIRIVEFIRDTKDCSRRKLLEALAPNVNLKSGQSTQEEPADDASAPSPEAAAVVADLHWLIYEGHVIEFSKGLIELAKKPIIKPPQPRSEAPKPKAPPKPAAQPAETSAESEAKSDAAATEPTATPDKPAEESGSEKTQASSETPPEPTAPESDSQTLIKESQQTESGEPTDSKPEIEASTPEVESLPEPPKTESEQEHPAQSDQESGNLSDEPPSKPAE